MRYRIEVFSQVYDVETISDSNGNITRLAINGQWFENKIIEDNTLLLDIMKSVNNNGENETTGEDYMFTYNNHDFNMHLELIKSTKSEITQSQDSSSFSKEILTSEGYIIAPMAGKIINIKIQQYDQITEGQILLVLEAMKMENEIISPVSGTVVRVAVEIGTMVTPNQILIELKPED